MYNQYLYNTSLYNLLPGYYGNTETYILKYGEYSFPNDGIVLTSLPNIDNNPGINFQNYAVAKTDGMGFSAYTLQSKQISITGWVRGKTRADMEEIILEMKKNLYKTNQKLFYRRGDGKVVYTYAYLTALTFDRTKTTINYVPFSITFTTLEPFFYRNIVTEYPIIGATANISGTVVYDQGTYRTNPTIYIGFNSASGVNNISYTIDGVNLAINETINAGDYVVIDSKNKEVSINGNAGKDYIGQFPCIDIGEKSLLIDINGTWNADIYIQWEDTYV